MYTLLAALVLSTPAFAQETTTNSLGLSGGVYAGAVVPTGNLFSYTYFSADFGHQLSQRWSVGGSTIIELDNLGDGLDALVVGAVTYAPRPWFNVGAFAGPLYVPGDTSFIAAAGGVSANIVTPWGPSLGAWIAANTHDQLPNAALQVSFPIATFIKW